MSYQQRGICQLKLGFFCSFGLVVIPFLLTFRWLCTFSPVVIFFVGFPVSALSHFAFLATCAF